LLLFTAGITTRSTSATAAATPAARIAAARRGTGGISTSRGGVQTCSHAPRISSGFARGVSGCCARVTLQRMPRASRSIEA
jgi:hypothetical protein